MTAIRMALSELRRLTAGRLPKLAVVALLLVPVLYGGLYLYANHDPYGRLDKIPTAVVVEDAGTTLATGEKLNVGPQVADELVKSKSFDWHQVDRAEATAGVSDGTYEFALVLPEDGGDKARQFAEKLRRQVEGHAFSFDGRRIPVTVSVGVADLGPEMTDPLHLLEAADARLYAAKRGGRNRVEG